MFALIRLHGFDRPQSPVSRVLSTKIDKTLKNFSARASGAREFEPLIDGRFFEVKASPSQA